MYGGFKTGTHMHTDTQAFFQMIQSAQMERGRRGKFHVDMSSTECPHMPFSLLFMSVCACLWGVGESFQLCKSISECLLDSKLPQCVCMFIMSLIWPWLCRLWWQHNVHFRTYAFNIFSGLMLTLVGEILMHCDTVSSILERRWSLGTRM